MTNLPYDAPERVFARTTGFTTAILFSAFLLTSRGRSKTHELIRRALLIGCSISHTAHAYSIKAIGAHDVDNVLSPILKGTGHSFLLGTSPRFSAIVGTIGFASIFVMGFVSLTRDVSGAVNKSSSDRMFLFVIWNVFFAFFVDRFLGALLRGFPDLVDFAYAAGMLTMLGGSFAYAVSDSDVKIKKIN